VSLPTPAVGQVVQYAYLWQHEKKQGWTDASKDRPAMIMYLHKVGDKVLAAVCPFSTLAPAEDERQASVEIDEATRRGLGLTGRQWARTDQINTFIWAGFDLRRVPGRRPPSFLYGVAPASFFNAVLQKLNERQADGKLIRISRD
jgi:hypothetical protein